MANTLEKIIKDKKETLNLIKKNNSLDSLEKKIKSLNFFNNFKKAIQNNRGISLISEIKKSSIQSSEKVWELPLWEEYSKDIKSKIADVKNLGRNRLAGTIAGGTFLKEFVNDTPWVHMDIAGTAWGPKEPAYMPNSGATGVGVRLIYNLIEKRIK